MRRRSVWAAVGVAAVAVAVVGLVLFQPWKLFVDTRVDEALPSATSPTVRSPAVTSPAAPTLVAKGSFVSFEHRTTGAASLLRLPDGSVVVRLESLATSDGPDVHVWLTRAKAAAGPDAFPAGHLELGRLKGNLGNQNYAVPAGTDLAGFGTVVLWCQRFSVAFGAATLVPS